MHQIVLPRYPCLVFVTVIIQAEVPAVREMSGTEIRPLVTAHRTPFLFFSCRESLFNAPFHVCPSLRVCS